MFITPCINHYVHEYISSFFDVQKWDSFQMFSTFTTLSLVVPIRVQARSLFYTLFVMSWTCLFPKSFLLVENLTLVIPIPVQVYLR